MFERDSIWMGLFFGLAVPFAGYGILLMVSEKLEVLLFPGRTLAEPLFDAATLQVIALCMNLIPLHFFSKRRFILGMRGVLISTMGYAVLWLISSGLPLFDGK